MSTSSTGTTSTAGSISSCGSLKAKSLVIGFSPKVHHEYQPERSNLIFERHKIIFTDIPPEQGKAAKSITRIPLSREQRKFIESKINLENQKREQYFRSV